VSPGETDWHRVHGDNVTGSYNVLLAAAEAGVKRVCAASSVNAIGGIFSRTPRYDYFPLDPAHPCYAEDPYSLSKWILEEQARSITRRFADLAVSCLRFSAIQERERRVDFGRRREDLLARDLWGYSPPEDCARVCLTAVTADLHGAEVFYVVARDTASEVPSEELRRRFYPDVTVRGDLSGHRAFYDSTAAREKLGWTA
jgi:nucleoside-diphosphate-sugar epimerase